jgi:hypothetical protein
MQRLPHESEVEVLHACVGAVARCAAACARLLIGRERRREQL